MNINKNIKRLFWILQISGWVTFYTIYLVLYYRDYLFDINKMAALLLTNLTGFSSTVILRLLYVKFNYDKKSIPQILLHILLYSFLFANFWLVVDIILTWALRLSSIIVSNFSVALYINFLWSNTFVFVAWSSLYFGIKFWFDYQTQKDRTEEAHALAQKAQLQMLRYQLNPHFLFNSLNSIRALVDEDQKKAKNMITELSEFLRYSLISKNFTNVPLIEELDAIKNYLSIEKTRFEENLVINYNIDENAENFPILSFLLHPLVENALKYGMATSSKPLIITISAKIINEAFHVEVCNSGKWVEKNSEINLESTGTGLLNVKRRLKNAFPNKYKFEIEKNESKVCIKIVIEK